MDTVALAKHSMREAARLLLAIHRSTAELRDTIGNMPNTEVSRLSLEAFEELAHAVSQSDAFVLAYRLIDEAADAKEDIALYGTRLNPVNKE